MTDPSPSSPESRGESHELEALPPHAWSNSQSVGRLPLSQIVLGVILISFGALTASGSVWVHVQNLKQGAGVSLVSEIIGITAGLFWIGLGVAAWRSQASTAQE